MGTYIIVLRLPTGEIEAVREEGAHIRTFKGLRAIVDFIGKQPMFVGTEWNYQFVRLDDDMTD
jgi:hypothetical protein